MGACLYCISIKLGGLPAFVLHFCKLGGLSAVRPMLILHLSQLGGLTTVSTVLHVCRLGGLTLVVLQYRMSECSVC